MSGVFNGKSKPPKSCIAATNDSGLLLVMMLSSEMDVIDEYADSEEMTPSLHCVIGLPSTAWLTDMVMSLL